MVKFTTFVPTKQKTTMTHQQNKQFNTYKEGLDLEFCEQKDIGGNTT